jgi:hypothetical protein
VRLGEVAIQPGRGQSAIGRIAVWQIARQLLGELDAEALWREGYETRQSFRAEWVRMYGEWNGSLIVDACRFHLLWLDRGRDAGGGDRGDLGRDLEG